MFTFPEIKTTRTPEEQKQKIYDELIEFDEAVNPLDRDKEAVDILHACETFLRVHFRGREEDLERVVRSTLEKNQARGYYTAACF